MNSRTDIRYYAVGALVAQGLACPERYLEMLKEASPDRVIDGLNPWMFLPNPERSVEYCAQAAGQSVLPFAQAVGEDSVACFVRLEAKEPGVVVINPWSEDASRVYRARLQDFSAWLEYAEQVARSVSEREADEEPDDD